ncbi:SIMPL domain-containing protein [Halobiforma lacisalsi AJ5]|uniref:SIMPL domain-containing protein n=1 Tax=Natronobacterium lacisalsi AJ5 TaxID=358396 RepID=M0LDZ7_NATLA|nr:SIMPL domain-containing protein [Halobiforma lacisalsi]APW96446.1 SIMPL domain-containing protein [Halobiforma lacisalsi AJ5]EMA31782.1 hypothetical protein C445_13245 [Halobiforma lacisalsi AJ5]
MTETNSTQNSDSGTEPNRRRFLAAAGVGAAASMAGCLGDALGSTTNASTGESNGTAEDDRTITVGATGEVEADPDEATVDVGVEARGESAEAVAAELASGADELRATFDELGIPDDNVEERRYRISPVRRREDDTTEIRGVHSFEVTIDDVDRVGDVIDAVAEGGADDIGRVNFTLGDDTRAELRKDALDEALANADEEAAHVADNRGVELEGTMSVATDDVRVRTTSYATGYESAADDAGGAPRTDIDADPVTVTASVTVEYAFSER